jgi:Cytochrome oxidase complex assembly protein 1
MSKKWLFTILTVVCLGVVLYTTVYSWVASSEGFAFVVQQIKSSDEIQAKVGSIRDVRLSPAGQFRLKWAGANERVFVVVDVNGTKKSIELKVNAEKTDGKWQLTSMKIE